MIIMPCYLNNYDGKRNNMRYGPLVSTGCVPLSHILQTKKSIVGSQDVSNEYINMSIMLNPESLVAHTLYTVSVQCKKTCNK